jgi:hypothetical protein
MKGCRLNSNMGAVQLSLEEVAFSYIFNFLRTAEMISLNLGTNDPLQVLYFKITFIKFLWQACYVPFAVLLLTELCPLDLIFFFLNLQFPFIFFALVAHTEMKFGIQIYNTNI